MFSEGNSFGLDSSNARDGTVIPQMLREAHPDTNESVLPTACSQMGPLSINNDQTLIGLIAVVGHK